MAHLNYYLFFDHIKIENANAISSPLTYGFPAISGFLGAIHALNRKIEHQYPIYLDGVLIACHDCHVQAFKKNRFADYTFNLTRNPLLKNGKAPSIIEEGRVHLDVSLVVEVKIENNSLSTEQQLQFAQQMKEKLYQQRIAGGNVVNIGEVNLYSAAESDETLINKLLPAFVLVDATSDLHEITVELQKKDEKATMLDALIETATLHHTPQGNGKFETTSIKKDRGWLVPLPLGYQAISPLFEAGKVEQLRSNHYPAQFVECIYGLGKWVFPHRLQGKLNASFWRYQASELQPNNTDCYMINQNLSN